MSTTRPVRPGRVLLVAVLTVLLGAAPLALAPLRAAAAGAISGVVNTYQAVSRVSGATLTLAGSPTGATRAFAAGDQVLVIQMTGTNPAAGPSSLGRYETAVVGAATSTTLTLTAPPTNTYAAASEAVQVVRMVGGAGTTTLTGTVRARPWDGRTGGVVALGGDRIDLAGQAIDVTGAGFTRAASAHSGVIGGNAVAGGSSVGRGGDGAQSTLGRVLANGAGGGGGGLGGAGGSGGNTGSRANNGGSVGGGVEPATGKLARGTDGAAGAPVSMGSTSAGGSGGGGGVIGGGGGGGGGDLAVASPGGGGGVTGGGGGGRGTLGGSSRAGGGGGGVGSVGNGGDGIPGGRLTSYGSAGGGGGSYGGGGASGGIQGAVSTGSGGGGGGSWTGGGPGGPGNGTILGYVGGKGNDAVGEAVPDDRQYLNDDDPRLMLGGSGGRGSADSGSLAGGAGGGIVLVRATSLVGGGSVRADGTNGLTPGSGTHSGSGGGGGGQVRIAAAVAASTAVSAKGGDGGRPSTGLLVGAGAAGGGGGGGAVWLTSTGLADSCGTTVAGAPVTVGLAGGASPQISNRLTGALTVDGGDGGTGLACTSALAVSSYAVGNLVFRDLNADGGQQAGESGVSGVAVTLVNAAGTTVATTTTDGTGRYLFDDLVTGTYRVRFGLPGRCAFSGPAVDPFSGTAAVSLVSGATGLRAPTAADGTVVAGLINANVDAGLVCSTTSPTALGGYTSAALSDLVPGSTGPFDTATGVTVLSTSGGSSSLVLQVSGIAASAAGRTYAARLHFGRCVAGSPGTAGEVYNTDLLDGEDPPAVNPTTEAWLDLQVVTAGQAVATTTVPFLPSAAQRSIVIHAQATDPQTGDPGAAVACLPLVIG